jgi:hypothetical protein
MRGVCVGRTADDALEVGHAARLQERVQVLWVCVAGVGERARGGEGEGRASERVPFE